MILLFRYEVRHNMDVSQTTLNIIFWYWGGFILIYNEESETSKLELSILRTFKNALPFPPKSTKPNPTLTFNYNVSLIVWNFINIQLLLFLFKFLFFLRYKWKSTEHENVGHLNSGPSFTYSVIVVCIQNRNKDFKNYFFPFFLAKIADKHDITA